MISLDQVLLLEQKVESAVAKIAQLNAENAALRSKCAELTNALSAKTEQFSSFQSDQGRIEEGILKALERLNTVENAVHAAAAGINVQQPAVNFQAQQAVKEAPAYTQPEPETVMQQESPVENTVEETQYIPDPSLENISENSFDTAAPVEAPAEDFSDDNSDDQQADFSNQPQFDIF